MSRVCLYISGPMTGYEDYNRPAFHNAAKELRKQGFAVINPAEFAIEDGTWSDYMRADIEKMMNADGLVVLEGWENSNGAKIEVGLAKALEMPIYEYGTMNKIEISVRFQVRVKNDKLVLEP